MDNEKLSTEKNKKTKRWDVAVVAVVVDDDDVVDVAIFVSTFIDIVPSVYVCVFVCA